MPSKGVLDRQRVGKAIVAAADTHAQEVGERLNDDLSVILAEGETLTDFKTLQLHLGRYLKMRLDALVAADEAHVQELDDDQDPRLRRDEAAELLYQKLIEVRDTVNAVFGSERAGKLVGIEGDTPRDPLVLHRHATRILDRLRAPDAELPPQRLRGVQLDPVVLAEELQPATDLLAEALADVDREQRETETTLTLKTEATEAFDRAVRGVGRILQGCDELADFPEFAEKIRLSRTHRGSRSGASEDEEGTSEEDDRPTPEEDEESPTTEVRGFVVPPTDEPPDSPSS
jgi:hypothetical protein